MPDQTDQHDLVPPAADRTGAITLTEVTRRYGIGKDQQISAAEQVSLAIAAGGLVALTGASGSGKSTLLHLIGAVERPDSGRIDVDGTEVTALRGGALAAYRRTVGFVFQRYNLLPALTALDNVIAPVLPYRTSWRPGPAAARGRRAGRPRAVAAQPDVGRRAAAGGHCPGADHPAVAAAG